MATQIIAGNATDGLRLDVDNTGALQIKTGAGAGTTAIGIDASQAVSIPGSLTVTGTLNNPGIGGTMNATIYTAPVGTPNAFNYTLSPSLKSVRITVFGGGGSGGAKTPSPTGTAGRAGCGGGGGASVTLAILRADLLSAYPSGQVPVVVGHGGAASAQSGGATSFGTFTSATAGGGGTPYAGGGTPAGGAGGVGSGGDFNATASAGSPGGPGTGGAGGFATTEFYYLYGVGGVPSPGAPGTPGTKYGGGGGGGAGPVPTSFAGGAGAPGVMIIEEFY